MRYTIAALSTLLTALNALTITSPAGGATIDSASAITVTWTSTSSDPATFNLVLGGSSLYGDGSIASNVQTSAGSYTIPAGTIASYGTGFTINAVTPSGDNIATSPSFVLSPGSTNPASTLSSLTFDTSGLEGQSATASYLPSTSVSVTVTNTDATATASESVTGSMTIMSTSTTRASSSARSSTSSASASAATESNAAQARVGAGKEIMGLAGLMAGLVALVA